MVVGGGGGRLVEQVGQEKEKKQVQESEAPHEADHGADLLAIGGCVWVSWWCCVQGKIGFVPRRSKDVMNRGSPRCWAADIRKQGDVLGS